MKYSNRTFLGIIGLTLSIALFLYFVIGIDRKHNTPVSVTCYSDGVEVLNTRNARNLRFYSQGMSFEDGENYYTTDNLPCVVKTNK